MKRRINQMMFQRKINPKHLVRCLSLFLVAACGTMAVNLSFGQILLSEDFEELPLGPFLDENLPDADYIDSTKVWTKTPPEGWTLDDSWMPEGGVRDWRGWSFANAQAWATVAGDQRRFEFTKGQGTVAIADPDEFDDMAHDEGTWEGYMSTPPISIAGAGQNTIILTFDSSWRPEAPQEALITASFDGGDPQDVLYWTSVDGDEFFHPDTSTNETVTVAIENPTGASSMVLTWGIFLAGNNWFWAVDNISVTDGSNELFSEDFEGLPLESFQDENLPAMDEPLDNTKVWTKTPPDGWEIDDSWMPLDGVRDWRGWSFAIAEAWAFVAGDQRRSEFTKGIGTVAIADPDEYDDMAHEAGTWESYLSTPPISLAGVDPNTIILTFDSSWRPEAPQEALITASYDGGNPQDVLYWTSVDGDEFFHPDTSTNETVTVEIENPAGADNMVLTWSIFLAGNNWFWAIDNVIVSSGEVTGIEDWQLY